jgi:zinc protease
MTRKQMVNFYKKYYHPKNAVLFVIGKFDKIKTMKLIQKYFDFKIPTKNINFPKAKLIFDGPKVNLLTKDVKETHFVLGFNAYKSYDKRNSVVSVINGILSSGFNSRLYLNVREKFGGAYYVHSSVDKMFDRGVFEVSAGVNNEKTKVILTEIIKELKRLKTELVDKKEIEKVKNRKIGSMLMQLDNPYTISYPIYNSISYKNRIETFRERINNILKVTDKDIMKISRDIFRADNIKMGVVTNSHKAKELESIIKNI